MNSISNTGTKQEQGYVFNPRSFGLRFWTVLTNRTGRGDFNGKLWCREGVDDNVDNIIKGFVYPHRDLGDKLIDLRDLHDIGQKCRFTIMRFDDRGDVNDYRVRQILKHQRGFLTLKVGTILYIRIGNCHIQICNMLDESGLAKISWDVREGKPRRIDDGMREIWYNSEEFRKEFQEEFRAATVNERYEVEESAFAHALQVAETQKKGPSEGSSITFHVVPTPPVEEMTLTAAQPPKGRRQQKVAGGQ